MSPYMRTRNGERGYKHTLLTSRLQKLRDRHHCVKSLIGDLKEDVNDHD